MFSFAETLVIRDWKIRISWGDYVHFWAIKLIFALKIIITTSTTNWKWVSLHCSCLGLQSYYSKSPHLLCNDSYSFSYFYSAIRTFVLPVLYFQSFPVPHLTDAPLFRVFGFLILKLFCNSPWLTLLHACIEEGM